MDYDLIPFDNEFIGEPLAFEMPSCDCSCTDRHVQSADLTELKMLYLKCVWHMPSMR